MKAILLLVAAIAFGIAPFVTEGFAGFRPDQFPVPQDDAPVQPAGYAFSIWSVIYVWLLLSAVVGVWRHRDDAAWDAARVPMIVSLCVGAFWIKVATLSVIWATVLIWVMLLGALWALIAGRTITPGWEFSWPTGLYAGWLTAASCVSIGLLGAGYGFGPAQSWAIAMILVALVLGVTVLRASGIWTYGVALAWALIGILVANGMSVVGGLALGGAVVIAALTLRQLRPAA
ncbi:hypothetical protein C8N43_1148 [Litoreibacter ponti]|uniref:TspO/MBR related protein n=1 Tax=Litoreibacter ponti TaxID=1510457 RepID=A0A2T6BK99_9RHOB|nr:hypothetical protein [Litoreibacter ponti]PTX56489.1 hypothetical protein C8N43_1148 [Litoreibacter ponti]